MLKSRDKHGEVTLCHIYIYIYIIFQILYTQQPSMIRRSFLPSSILRWPPSTMNSYIPTWFQIGLAIGKVFTHLHYLPLQMKTSADSLPPHFQHLHSIHTFTPCGTAQDSYPFRINVLWRHILPLIFLGEFPVSRKKVGRIHIHIPIPMGIPMKFRFPWIHITSHGSRACFWGFIFLINRFRSDRWWFGVPLLMRGPLLSLPVVWAADFPEAQAREPKKRNVTWAFLGSLWKFLEAGGW